MEIWLRSLAFSSLLLIAGKAVDPSCECLVFSSTFGRSEGRFSSPDFPKPYPRDINCILYTFIAGSQEIIELTFSDFNVGHADKECGSGDWLKVFQDLERPEVNERTPWSGMLCGNTLPTLYSSGSILMLEFHSGSINTNSTGFKGTFSFVDKSKYRIEGVKTPGSTCDYQFSNTNDSSSRGRFFSPEYPSSYPKNSTCVYRFRANRHVSEPNRFLLQGDCKQNFIRQGERVRILFEDIHFQKGDLSCLDREDILKAHDGGAVQAPLVAVFCNQMSNTELISTTNQLYLEFTSSSEWPGHGFTATYHYEELKEAKGVDLSKLADIGPAVSAARSSCDVKISSDSTKKGQLFSPGFPVGYLSSTRCRYEFQGSGKERVKIVFTYFNLFTRGSVKAKECNGEDSVTPYVIIDGRPEKLESYCGNTIPKPIMSNGPRLVLEFTSFNSSKGSGGFRAEYFFIKDFGITTGKQLTDYPCAFRYSSKDGLTGHFHSPNYPGLYPRDTECHYFFHRTMGHKTKIYFTFFDIEGIYPCNTGTASDYLESFNFMDNDKLHTRYCGQLDPFEIVKESRFFRVTFRSNDRLDGLGFNASYRFINVPSANKKVPFNFSYATKSVSQPLAILSLIIMMMFV